MSIVETQEKPALLRRDVPGMAKKLHRGMQAIAVIAKLYRKYHVTSGQTPVFAAIKLTDSPARQAERVAKSRVQVGQFACRRCRKPFVGKERCQCKAVIARGSHHD